MTRPAPLLALLMSAVVSACGGGSGASAGQALYQANCSMCHGEGALGDGPMATSLPVKPPSLLEHLGHHTQAQLVGLIRDGVPPAMPPAALSDEQVAQVIEYVWTLVHESQVEALRAMRDQMEAASGSAPRN